MKVRFEMNLFRTFTLIVFLTSLSIFSGCDTNTPIGTGPIRIVGDIIIEPVGGQKDDLDDSGVTNVPVGVVVSLTGKHAKPYGLPMYRGFELAREHINSGSELGGGIHIDFVISDDKSTVEGAQLAVQSLVNNDVSSIVGIALSTQLKDAFPIAQANGVVAFSSLSSAAGLSSIGDYIFRAAIAADIFIPRGVSLTQPILNYKKVAIIYDENDTYSTSIKDELKTALEQIGVEILVAETYQTGDTDFTAQLTNIKDMGNDAVFVAGLVLEMREIIKQARDIGIPEDVELIIPDLTQDDITYIGDAAEGVITFLGWSELSDTPGNQAFVDAYEDAYGISPEPWAAQSYATLLILAEAIKNAQSTDSDDIRDALSQITNFPTLLGNFSFDLNGEAIYDPIVLIVKNAELLLFEYSDQRTQTNSHIE